jgi:phage terminase large subunit GpA-like protein
MTKSFTGTEKNKWWPLPFISFILRLLVHVSRRTRHLMLSAQLGKSNEWNEGSLGFVVDCRNDAGLSSFLCGRH